MRVLRWWQKLGDGRRPCPPVLRNQCPHQPTWLICGTPTILLRPVFSLIRLVPETRWKNVQILYKWYPYYQEVYFNICQYVILALPHITWHWASCPCMEMKLKNCLNNKYYCNRLHIFHETLVRSRLIFARDKCILCINKVGSTP